MERISVRWIEPQHSGDDFDQIKQAMGGADDEGSIILLPVRQRDGGISKARVRDPAQLFENPLWLIAHLVEHGDDLNREFWLGICEASPKGELGVAISGLWYFKELLNNLGGMSRRSPPGGSQGRCREIRKHDLWCDSRAASDSRRYRH